MSRRTLQLFFFLLVSCAHLQVHAQLFPPGTLSYERTGVDEVILYWEFPSGNQPYSINDLYNWMPQEYFFLPKYQSCLVSDGKYLYSCYDEDEAGSFLKYDMKGNYLETIKIEGLPGIYKLTWDGRYFYGILYGKPGIYKFDMENRKLLDIMPTSEKLYRICYIPDLDSGKGGFEVGNPATGHYVKMDGTYLSSGINTSAYLGCSSIAYYDGKLYASCQSNGQPKIVVEYDYHTNMPTGKRLDMGDFVGVIDGFMDGYCLDMTFVEFPAGTIRALALNYYSTPDSAGPICNVFKVGEDPLLADLEGYNTYVDSKRSNSSLISRDSYRYIIQDLEEDINYQVSLKAVYKDNNESQASEITVYLSPVGSLPLVEDFSITEIDGEDWSTNTSLPAWSIIDKHDEYTTHLPFVQYHYRFSTDYTKMLTSKKHKAGKGDVFLRYDILAEPNGLRNEVFSAEIQIEDGEWRTISEENCTSVTEWTTKLYDITETQGKNFRLRFLVKGNAGNTSYKWYLDNIRIWNANYTRFEGKVYQQAVPAEQVTVRLEKSDDPLTAYQTSTGNGGNFIFEKIEEGTYTIFISRDNEILFSSLGYVIENNLPEVSFTIPSPKLEIDNSMIRTTLSENKKSSYSREIANHGDASFEWKAIIQYDADAQEHRIGNSDIVMAPLWELDNLKYIGIESGNWVYDPSASMARESGMVFHKGYLYCIDSRIYGTGYILNKYTPEGELVTQETISTSQANYFIASLVSDGENLYQLSTNPGRLYPIDLENKKIKENEAIATTIDRVLYAAYDPVSDGFYVGAEHMMYLINRNGRIQDDFDITGTYASGIALDSFSEGGPYLWIICTVFAKVEGTGNYDAPCILQYSLKEKKITGVVKMLEEDVARLIDYPLGQDYSFFGSTAIVPGYFTITAVVDVKGKELPLLLTYKLVPYENWLLLDNYTGILQPGEQSELSMLFNTTQVGNGEEKEVTIMVQTNYLSDAIEIPVKLTVDNSIEVGCWVPDELKGELTNNYQVNLSWTLPAGANPLKGYNVFREGNKINEELIEGATTYTDVFPGMGLQSYTVTAIYQSGVESHHSEPFEITISDPSIVKPVADLKANVLNKIHVQLDWKAPGYGNGFFEDFENYQPFVLRDNLGGWTLYDGDKAWTLPVAGSYVYPNREERMSFMVFNPANCYPEMGVGSIDGKAQMLAGFSTNIEGLANDDWFISPLLDFDRPYTISFAARGYANKTFEQINIGYSYTDNKPESFVFVNGDTPINVSEYWTSFKYAIPQDAKYVAINYVTNNGYAIFIDNVYVGHDEYYSEVTGYNLYREGVQLNSTPMKVSSYIDPSLTSGEYTYEIEALYANGNKSRTAVNVTVGNSSEATPPRDLNASRGSSDRVQLNWTPPLWSDPVELRYDDGIPYNSVGSDERQFVGIRWYEEDIKMYQGYSITGVRFHLLNYADYIVPFLYENNNLVVEAEEFENSYGEITYLFKEPVVIKPNCTYTIGYIYECGDNIDPVAHDAGLSIPGKSDLVSNDGINWYSNYELSYYYDGVYDATCLVNWNIAALIELQGEVEEVASTSFKVPQRVSQSTGEKPKPLRVKEVSSPGRIAATATQTSDRFLGYFIYRNDVKLNNDPVSERSYSDTGIGEDIIKYRVTAYYETSGEVSSEELVFDPTNIQEHNSLIGIEVYPNPVNDRLYIKGTYDLLTLLSLEGKVLQTVSGTTVMEETEINVGSYTSGVYLLMIEKDNSTQYVKIMIQ